MREHLSLDVTPELRLDALRGLLHQHQRLEQVTFEGQHDPLLHPRIAYLVRAARECGPAVRLVTGGLGLEGRLLRDLIEAGLDEVHLTLGGWDRESYLRLHGVDQFQQVVTNLAAFADVRHMLLAPNPLISATLVLDSTFRGAERYAIMLARLGVVRLEVTPEPGGVVPEPLVRALADRGVAVTALPAPPLPEPAPEEPAPC
jgi:pyruvate-formate lyase-activating enzyme